MQKPFLSVVITSYNEEANLERGVLNQVSNYLKKQKFSWEVIINDDGSTDGSDKLLKEQISKLKGFKFIQGNHGGKPAGLLNGLKNSSGKWVLFTDVDQSTPIAELDKLLPFIDKYDVVIGSRGLNRKDFSLYRKLGSVVFLTFRRLLLLPEIEDTQCGFKLFKRDYLTEAFPKLEFFKTKQRATGWKVTSYDVELLHILKKKGCKIKEVEVLWKDRDISKYKGSKLSRYIRESKEMFTQIIRVKLNDLRGMYE